MSDSKQCHICKQVLPLTQFRADRTRPDGLTYRCWECEKAYKRKWVRSESGRANNQKKQQRYRERYPEKEAAHDLARTLFGPMKTDTCPECGETEQLEKHHPDYSQPAVIVEICRACHKKGHNND